MLGNNQNPNTLKDKKIDSEWEAELKKANIGDDFGTNSKTTTTASTTALTATALTATATTMTGNVAASTSSVAPNNAEVGTSGTDTKENTKYGVKHIILNT